MQRNQNYLFKRMLLNDPQSALLQRALKEGVAVNNQADVEFKSGNYQRALSLYLKALEIKEAGVGKYGVRCGLPLIGLAETYIKLKEYKNALVAATRLKKLAKKNNLPEQIRISRLLIDEINQKDSHDLYCEKENIKSEIDSSKCVKCNSIGKYHCGSCKLVNYCSPDCQMSDWKSHRIVCDNNSSNKKCGLCGHSGTRFVAIIKTDCCQNWICQDMEYYEIHSFKLNSCFRNHQKYTKCGQHFKQKHVGNWQNCDLCLEKEKSAKTKEEIDWYRFANEHFDFGIGSIGSAEQQRNILLKTDETRAPVFTIFFISNIPGFKPY